ncbi:MAG TPA: hypothetical protein VN903_29220 [Polyangia bacterium]|nr:hypothetical protein [Polyangia bacterium]
MTQPFDTEDLDMLAADLGGAQFTLDGTTVDGELRVTDEDVLPGVGAPQRLTRLLGRVRTGALPGLEVGAAIDVAAPNFTGSCTVSELARIQNGDWTEILLDTA